MENEFINILGYEDLYQINQKGEIKSLRSNKLLKHSKNKEYPYVNMTDKNNKHKLWAIHRLIAIHYVPNPSNYTIVNHIDHNKYNFAINNLEWVTQSENAKLSRYHHKFNKPVRQLDKDGNILNEFESSIVASEKTGVSSAHISQCCQNKKHYNTAGGYKWEYVNDNSYTPKNKEVYEKLDGEVFKKLDNYNGFNLSGYEVSNYGTIINNKGYRIKTRITADYEVVCIRKCMVRVHRVVATLFLPNPDNKPIVNHKDENKSNNNVSNLEWVTNQENLVYSYGKTVCMYDKVNNSLLKEFSSIHEAYAFLGKTVSGSISQCCNGKAKTCLGYIWRWKE